MDSSEKAADEVGKQPDQRRSPELLEKLKSGADFHSQSQLLLLTATEAQEHSRVDESGMNEPNI